MQPGTRCSDGSCQAAEYLIAGSALRKRIAQANFKLAAVQRLFSVAPWDIKLSLFLLWLLCQKGRRCKNKAQRIDLEQLRLEFSKGID